jgi:hypothetical protein
MTDEEKAEARRLLEMIGRDRHSDTGNLLHPSGERTPKAYERETARMQRDINMSLYGVLYPTAMDRIMRDFEKEEQNCKTALNGTLHPDVDDRVSLDEGIGGLAGPLAESAMLVEQLYAMRRDQNLLDVAMGEPRDRAIRGQMDLLDQRRRYLDPLLDCEFVRRLTGGLDEDLSRRATVLREREALRLIREQVDSAAALRISNEWKLLDQAREHVAALPTIDPSARSDEVQRMLAIYGPAIAEQTRFLAEYRANLRLFDIVGLTSLAYERADLLARVVMPASLATGFAGYDASNVSSVQTYGEAILHELEADFSREGNPVYSWEAVAIARRYGIAPPDWAQDFLADAADRIMEICDEVASGTSVNRESERVGRALGFGLDGPGQGGWFKHATMLKRDRTIYSAVGDELEAGSKLDFAYDEVARALCVSRSTIVRAWLRIKKLNGATGCSTERKDQVS